MRATSIILASVCALALTGRALAGCPVADATGGTHDCVPFNRKPI
jgi:hypothetical protein